MVTRVRIGAAALLAAVVLAACGGDALAPSSDRGREVPQPPLGLVPIDLPRADAGPIRFEPRPPVEPDEPETFDDPGCPPARPLPDINECNPLATPTGCAESQGCYPFVSYPRGPCEVERFGTVCASVGPGTQGDPCSTIGCAADHICVSTGRGTQCVRLCNFEQENTCAAGFLCLPIDIDGFGGCL